MGRLEGKVALVTGAAHERGIGRGIVRELAAEGARVAVADLAHEEMGEAMAIELAPHRITVNHIGPGWVLSALNDPSPALEDDQLLRDSLAQIPLGGRAADPRELGRAVVYLASPDGDYVTGEYLRVDGGFAVGKFA